MTDEEMAEEYVCNKADKGNFDLEKFGKAYFSESSMKQAFIAGYKAGWKEMTRAERMKGVGYKMCMTDELEKVKRTERGWAGHFCCAEMCRFRRNTLLEYNGKAIVVSTVGAMYNNKGELEEIGIGRHYETMAFYADDSEYKDAKVADGIYFDSPWQLKWHKDGYIDNEVNAMHEKVVEELSKNLLKGVL